MNDAAKTTSQIKNAEAIREVQNEIDDIYNKIDEGATALGITWGFTTTAAELNKQLQAAKFKLARLEGRL